MQDSPPSIKWQPSKERFPSIDLLPVGRPIGLYGCNDDLLVQEAFALGLRSSLFVGQIFELVLSSQMQSADILLRVKSVYAYQQFVVWGEEETFSWRKRWTKVASKNSSGLRYRRTTTAPTEHKTSQPSITPQHLTTTLIAYLWIGTFYRSSNGATCIPHKQKKMWTIRGRLKN